MTVRELIDFCLKIRQPDGLIGFEQLHEEEVGALKQAVQDHYGNQTAWLALPEDTPLPDHLEKRALALKEQYRSWSDG